MEGSILAQRERVSLGNGMALRLLSALEVLQARREAGELAGEDRERALCSNACLLARALEQKRQDVCVLALVDTLEYLKRGGRISATTALFGTMLAIKPVMHVDDEGRLIPVSKARGRKASLTALVDRMEATAIDPAGQTVFISHGDCLEDAEFVAGEVRRRLGVETVHINYVGPVIGNHSGPGTMALFFLGSER